MEERHRELLKLIHKDNEDALMEFYDSTCYDFAIKMQRCILDQTKLEDAFADLYFTIQLKSRKIAKCPDIIVKCYEIIESVSRKYNKKYRNKPLFKLNNLDFSKKDCSKFDKEELISSLKTLTKKEYKVFIILKWEEYSFEEAEILLNMKRDKLNYIYNNMSKKLANVFK